MTYLELCQNYVGELGIAGGKGPAAVTGQTGELANVVRWIRDASLDIDSLWLDWSYLWRQYDVTLNSNLPPPPAPPANNVCRRWDRDSAWINYGTAAARKLPFRDFAEFKQLTASGITAGTPSEFTVRPDNQIVLNHVPTAGTPFHIEYWKQPKVLVANDDVPDLPSEFHRQIICRAAIYYGNREAAPEIISGMEAEYVDRLEKLESAYCSGFRSDRMSTPDLQQQVELQ